MTATCMSIHSSTSSIMNYSSYQLCSQLCVSTIYVSCVYAAIATRRIVRARAGGPPVPGHVCVCVCVAQM